MALRLPPPSTTGLAQIFMAEPAAPSAEPKSEHREAVVELLRQVAGLVATVLRGTSGEIQLRLNAVEGAPSWPASSTAWIRAGTDEAAIAWIEVYLSAALLTSLRADTSEALSKAPDRPAGESIPPQGNVNLDLLMDVELAVTLRFGSRRLLLREILELNPGAVVELDRQVNEPVDVLLDGRVVARGEVVVVDGNYGLRVTEVAQGA
jgi:flagellar motor switch protein FliN/FliY